LSTKSKSEIVRVKPGNGLVGWKQKQAEDKKQRMAELELLREDAVMTTIDGQEFRVVTIPDNYAWNRPAPVK
jgi:hypothetical protein